jgi:hypothetical protein
MHERKNPSFVRVIGTKRTHGDNKLHFHEMMLIRLKCSNISCLFWMVFVSENTMVIRPDDTLLHVSAFAFSTVKLILWCCWRRHGHSWFDTKMKYIVLKEMFNIKFYYEATLHMTCSFHNLFIVFFLIKSLSPLQRILYFAGNVFIVLLT